MSDFLYIMGELDERVRPLIFAIRNWAKIVGITNSAPGRWISNFSLTLLVLAFLQNPQSGKPVLPTLNQLGQLAGLYILMRYLKKNYNFSILGKNDQFLLEDGTDCTFLRDITNYKHETKNTDTLEELLIEFFVHYAHFDFENKAVCLNDTAVIAKPEHTAMYIINPLERGLNVSRNVSIEEVTRFKSEVKNAAWVLESNEKSLNWGLLSIQTAPNVTNSMFQKAVAAQAHAKAGRLVEIKSIFEKDAEDMKRGGEKVKNKQR